MGDETLAVILTLTSFGLLVYTHVGYPALLWLLNKLLPLQDSPSHEPAEWPEVSILVSAYNEEAVIADRLENLLDLDYPRERLEILVGSDGSSDRTCEIVEGFKGPGIRLIPFEERRGKASVLNDLVAQARGEIVVLTDANTFFYSDAVRELVKALWRHPSACAVLGRLDMRSSSETGKLQGVYWRYDTFIKTLESRFGSVVGGNGGLYAFRRQRYRPLSREAISNDDFLIPLLMRLHSGGQVFFVPSARAWEMAAERIRDEFRRYLRIGAGGLQALLWTWRLLLPWKGMVAVTYFSHKVLRWFGPWFMLIGFGANLWLLDIPFFQVLFLGQLMLYGVGVGATLFRHVPILGKAAARIRYFLVLNAALMLGFIRFALGVARPTWDPMPRTVSTPTSVR
jgi:cellulose synthase/poly-beta-1,6-N-acetylglucosamine synthase-like glycosyltransferase